MTPIQSNEKLSRIVLTGNDVPGASLNGKNQKAKKRRVEALIEVQRGECIRYSYATSTKVTTSFSIPASFLLSFMAVSYS